MKKSALFMILLLLMTTQFNTVSGERYEIENVSVEIEKTSIELWAEEVKGITITISNECVNVTDFQIRYVSSECLGLTAGSFSKENFTVDPELSYSLLPFHKKNFTLYLKGSERSPRCDGAEDGSVIIEWDVDAPDVQTKEKRFNIDVKKRGRSDYFNYILAGIIIAGTAIGFYVYRSKKES